MVKKALIGIGASIVLLLLWQIDLVYYGLLQGKGQLKVIMEAHPIEEFLDDPNFADSLKQKLKLVQEIRQFSTDVLGINESNNYTSLYDQKGRVTLWNLTACEPFELKAKTWGFPIIGSFPYKGFFDLEKAKEARDELNAAGYDTRIRPVSGWSTLGWFNDPILSNMLNRPEGALAELIIHELTHGTLYIRDSADYNENLATFIGQKGAQLFLKSKYGQESPQLIAYIQNEYDYKRYIDHFIVGSNKLDSLYGTMNASLSEELKNNLKQELIQKIVNNIDTIKFYRPRNFIGRFEKTKPNNAYFMSFLRYHAKQDKFEKEFNEKFKGDVRSYLIYLKQKYPSL